MKTIIIVIIFSFSITSLSAQTVAEIKGSRDTEPLNIITTKGVTHKSWGFFTGKIYKKDNSYWTIHKVSKSRVTVVLNNNPEGVIHYDYYIKTYNSDLVETSMQKIIVDNYDVNTYLWKFVKVKDNILAIFLTRDSENNKKIVSASELNTTSFEIKHKPKKLVELDWNINDTKNSKEFYIKNNSEFLSDNFLVISFKSHHKDKENLLLGTKKKSDKSFSSLWVYNDELDLLNSRNTNDSSFDVQDGYSLRQTTVGTNGEIYSLYLKLKITEELPGPFLSKQTTDYTSFMVIRKDTKGVIDVLVPNEDKALFDLRILERPDSSLVLIGLSANKIGKKYLTNGLSVVEVESSDFTVISISDYPFDEELLNNVSNIRDPKIYESELIKRKKKKESITDDEKKTIQNVSWFSYVGMNFNGSVSIVLEEFDTEVQTHSSANGGMDSRTIYKYGDIVICNIGNNKASFDYIKKNERFSSGSKIYSLDPLILKNGDLQFLTLGSIVRFPLNGEKIKTAIFDNDNQFQVGKKTKKFKQGSIVFLSDNEVLKYYWKFTRQAWVRIVIKN
tara:strand:- start:246 stop:1925 length:1680 start_codon:yes stop_codon:yes gene_type:complete